MRKDFFIFPLLIILIALSGCTYLPFFQQNNPYTGEGVLINVESNPQKVLENSETVVFIDVENKDIKTMNRVFIDIYDPGNFEVLSDFGKNIKIGGDPPEGFGEGSCSGGTHAGTCANSPPDYCDSKRCSVPRCNICGCSSNLQCLPTGQCGKINPCTKFVKDMDVGESQTLECELRAKQVPYTPYNSKIYARVRYEANFTSVQSIEMMSEEWYQSHYLAGTLERKPKVHTHNDKNLELQLEFSDELPIIVQSGKQSYLKFKIRNIGNGFISSIRSADFKIIQSDNVVKNCGIDACAITPLGKEFPAFTCELDLKENINYLNNYIIIINIRYWYEVREELPIEIIR